MNQKYSRYHKKRNSTCSETNEQKQVTEENRFDANIIKTVGDSLIMKIRLILIHSQDKSLFLKDLRAWLEHLYKIHVSIITSRAHLHDYLQSLN